ncbi:MAG: VCBS repeat-containing protein [Myxococcaceae bacterium]
MGVEEGRPRRGGWPLVDRARDFDSDGRPDLVVANYSGNSVSVLLDTSLIASELTLLEEPVEEDLRKNRALRVSCGCSDSGGQLGLAALVWLCWALRRAKWKGQCRQARPLSRGGSNSQQTTNRN